MLKKILRFMFTERFYRVDDIQVVEGKGVSFRIKGLDFDNPNLADSCEERLSQVFLSVENMNFIFNPETLRQFLEAMINDLNLFEKTKEQPNEIFQQQTQLTKELEEMSDYLSKNREQIKRAIKEFTVKVISQQQDGQDSLIEVKFKVKHLDFRVDKVYTVLLNAQMIQKLQEEFQGLCLLQSPSHILIESTLNELSPQSESYH